MTEENLLTTDIPEKFKDPETGAVRMDDFVKSYRELEKQFSQRPSAPKSPQDYCIDCQHGLFEADEHINARMHAKGFTQDQAQEAYNMAAETMMPMISRIAADFEADRQVEKLINHFGGADQWKAVSKQLLAFGQKTLPPETLENMTSSYEGVLALHRLMMSEEPNLPAGDHDQNGLATTEKDLQKMMRDPRYWRDRDPEFVKQVTDGFKGQYGS